MSILEWEFRFLNKDSEAPLNLATDIHGVFRDGFAIEGWSLEGIKETLGRCAVLGLLLGKDREICGYAFYSTPETQLMGTFLLWEDAICLKKSAQHQGFSEQAIELVRGLYPKRQFGWIGGRTQNPFMMKRYSKYGPSYPFDASYYDVDGPKVTDFLVKHIDEVKKAPSFDPNTGICARVYKDGLLGDYPWNNSGNFESRLLQWGFDRSRGDAIIVVARIQQS